MLTIRRIRIIFDNNEMSVSVLGKPQDGGMDLSKCTLRAGHPVHTAYLKNMGVRSCMSIAIVVDNDLWGLMCFHAYGKPLHPRGWETSLFESLSVPVSNSIAKIHCDLYEKRRNTLSCLVDKGFSADGVFELFESSPLDFLKVLEADCLAILREGRVRSWGDASLVVTAGSINHILRNADGKDWAVGKLNQPPSGVMCIAHEGIVIACVRKSTAFEKVWGGDPFHVKIMRPDGVPGPSGAFERYVQSGVDSLNRWNLQDKQLATYLSSRIKLLSKTAILFENKSNLLCQAEAAGRPGRVDYATVATGAAASKPVALDPALISHFSHEIKTPIHGLSSTLTLLLEDSDMTQRGTREHLLYGQECVKRVSQAVDDVLSIAGGGGVKCNARKSDEVEKLCLEPFLDTLREQFSDEGTFTASNNVDEAHCEIMVNFSVLHHTLCALIRNSMSSAESTHVSASYSSTHREAVMAWKEDTEAYSHRNIRNAESTDGLSESDTWYTFSVKDSGCGIHDDMLNNVLAYDNVTRASATLGNSHQGVGVGVYECITNIIFHLNGSVAIASTVSNGTTVSLMLPAKPVVRASRRIEHGDAGTFLVVDDNTINRRLAARMIKIACTKRLGVEPMIK